jgi:hypothetical protein
MAGIGEEDDARRLPVSGDLVGHLLEIGLRVDGDGKDLRVLLPLVFEQVLQLAELSSAVGSPMSAVKHQHYVLPVFRSRKLESVTVPPSFDSRVKSGAGLPTATRSRSVAGRPAPSVGPSSGAP